MPYFADSSGRVVVTIGGATAPPDAAEIPPIAAKHAHLRHGDQLPDAARVAVESADWDAFIAAFPESEPPRDAQLKTRGTPLPPLGRWEYKVVPITELAGFATAKGTASRMEAALNQLGADGWELTTATDRASRWMSGETVILTFRRFVTTEEEYELRVRVEESVRRRVQETQTIELTERAAGLSTHLRTHLP